MSVQLVRGQTVSLTALAAARKAPVQGEENATKVARERTAKYLLSKNAPQGFHLALIASFSA